ncbi:MAG: hypothetical protein BroJett039_01440 [Chloroflexota bacterium]|nr:MAG: hypothetical protein BroJett039_01440 [Chloroflexota bacterium]
MCRSIKQLRRHDAQPTEQEIYDAARQFVRKVSGYRAPSKKNQEIFEQAIQEIASATRKMLDTFSQAPSFNPPSPLSRKEQSHA